MLLTATPIKAMVDAGNVTTDVASVDDGPLFGRLNFGLDKISRSSLKVCEFREASLHAAKNVQASLMNIRKADEFREVSFSPTK